MIKVYCDMCGEEVSEANKMCQEHGLIGNRYFFGTAYINGQTVKFAKFVLICNNCKTELDTMIYIHLKKKGVELNDK